MNRWGGNIIVYPGRKSEFPERLASHYQHQRQIEALLFHGLHLFNGWIASPRLCLGVQGRGKRGEGKGLSQVLWFRAVPFVFLEDESALAGCWNFCLASSLSVFWAPCSHCTLSSQRDGFVDAGKKKQNASWKNVENCLINSHGQHGYFIFILFFFSTKLLVTSPCGGLSFFLPPANPLNPAQWKVIHSSFC